MTLRASIVAIASCVTSLLLAAGTARAITLPDNSSCNDSRANCLRITNAATTGGNAILGISSSGTAVAGGSTSGVAVSGGSTSGYGVWGNTSSSYGVYGVSSSAAAIYGSSSTGNGLVGQNNNTDHAAAAVSALSADGENGLAYWGTGAIQITSSVAEKAGGGAWQVFSDARIKKDIAPFRLGVAQLKEVRPVTFKYNGLGGTTDNGHEFVGVIAQELEKVFPSMVTSRKGKLHPTDTADTDIKIVDPSALTFVLINSVKEQQAIIERQERRIAALERGRGVSASLLGNGTEMGLALGLLPLGFVALRRRKASKGAVPALK